MATEDDSRVEVEDGGNTTTTTINSSNNNNDDRQQTTTTIREAQSRARRVHEGLGKEKPARVEGAGSAGVRSVRRGIKLSLPLDAFRGLSQLRQVCGARWAQEKRQHPDTIVQQLLLVAEPHLGVSVERDEGVDVMNRVWNKDEDTGSLQ